MKEKARIELGWWLKIDTLLPIIDMKYCNSTVKPLLANNIKLMFHYPKGIVSNYCYNIFLFHFHFMKQFTKWKQTKNKSFFCFLVDWVEWMVEWVGAPSIKKFHFFNYGVMGYMLLAHQPIHSLTQQSTHSLSIHSNSNKSINFTAPLVFSLWINKEGATQLKRKQLKNCWSGMVGR